MKRAVLVALLFTFGLLLVAGAVLWFRKSLFLHVEFSHLRVSSNEDGLQITFKVVPDVYKNRRQPTLSVAVYDDESDIPVLPSELTEEGYFPERHCGTFYPDDVAGTGAPGEYAIVLTAPIRCFDDTKYSSGGVHSEASLFIDNVPHSDLWIILRAAGGQMILPYRGRSEVFRIQDE